MTSHRPLFWRAFVLPIFGPKVQAEAKILQQAVKIKGKMMTFLELLGPCRKEKYFLIEIFHFFKLSNLRIKTNISQ